MASFKNFITLVALCAILGLSLAQTSQGGPHTSQGGSGGPQGGAHENQGSRQAQDVDDDDENDNNPPEWTTCDFTVEPKLSCSDCHTRVICKPIGGLVKHCQNPRRPYCNNGLCSPVPSPDCA